ncbi:MAG: ABC transporter ATP-binding protein [Ignavibacteriales bacterium]|nr:ABC transporter ATP-binding protein [Ignavibacteriales bacterium]
MGMTRRSTLLTGENIWKEYPMGKNQTLQVLKGVDIEIRHGEFVVIVGPSGSGKSTLLHILGGLDRPTDGMVKLGDQNVFAHTEEQLAIFRNRSLGFIFQFHHLLPEFSALENVCMPALIAGKTIKEATPRAQILLEQVGLSDRARHKPNELSGGEQQRVAVARALMNNPKIVLADEPSGNLDEENGLSLHRLLVHLSEEFGMTFVVATHNFDLTRRAHRVLRLSDGKLNIARHQ